MKLVQLFTLTCLLFIVACTKSNKYANFDVGTFTVSPTPVDTDLTTALTQLNTLITKTTSERDENSSIKQENIAPLLGQTLGVIQKFPADKTVVSSALNVAEILDLTKNYEDAASLFKLIYTTFPKGDQTALAELQYAKLLEKELGKTEDAIAIYSDFIKVYPEHPLVGTAERSLYELTK